MIGDRDRNREQEQEQWDLFVRLFNSLVSTPEEESAKFHRAVSILGMDHKQIDIDAMRHRFMAQLELQRKLDNRLASKHLDCVLLQCKRTT